MPRSDVAKTCLTVRMLNVYGMSQAKVAVALCAAANFINAADRVIMPTAIIQMSEEFKWTLHGQGWILSSFSVGYMASGVSISKYSNSRQDNYVFCLEI